jgi:hypothetical protein
MFAFYASIFTVALSMYPSVSAQNAAGFDALSVPERREAIQQVANGIRAGESVDSKAMAMVGMALGDSDPIVRRYAVGSISTILHRNGSPYPQAESVAAIRSLPLFETNCLHNLTDPDVGVRGVCADALLTVAPPLSSESRRELVSMYYREQNGMVRLALVSGLGAKAIDSPDVRQLLVAALDDPHNPVLREAAREIAKFQPAEALPKIAAVLQSGRTEPRAGQA